MASIRKRTWKTDGETRSAWAVDWSDTLAARHRRQFPTRREADAFRTEIEDQLRKGLFRSEAQKLTIAELAARYIEYLKGRNRRGEGMTQGTLHNYEGKIRNYILSEDPKATLCRYSSKLTLFEGARKGKACTFNGRFRYCIS